MIKPSTLIEFMRANRTGGDNSAWSVDYASRQEDAENKSQLPLPCFFVDINTTTADVTSEGDYEQLFRTNIRIRLICRSQEDRKGKTGADVAYEARLELFKILLFKKLDERYNEVYFVGDSFESLDEARYTHVFDFMFTGKLDPSALTLDEFVDLQSIYIDYDLVESDPSEQPNAQNILDTFQD